MGGVTLNVLRGLKMSACCKRFGLALLLWAGVSGSAAAQTLPKPKEFYFDADPMAVTMRAIDSDAADVVDQLMRQRQRGRRAVEASVQLARMALREGRSELAAPLYEEALAQASSTQQRGVRWNQGWDLYRSGDHAGALEAWSQALQLTRLSPSWAPPTLAIGLWQSGRRDEAVAWYAAAVRTEPQDWSDAGNHVRLLPDWSDAERTVLAQVHAAWAANPPAWP